MTAAFIKVATALIAEGKVFEPVSFGKRQWFCLVGKDEITTKTHVDLFNRTANVGGSAWMDTHEKIGSAPEWVEMVLLDIDVYRRLGMDAALFVAEFALAQLILVEKYLPGMSDERKFRIATTCDTIAAAMVSKDAGMKYFNYILENGKAMESNEDFIAASDEEKEFARGSCRRNMALIQRRIDAL